MNVKNEASLLHVTSRDAIRKIRQKYLRYFDWKILLYKQSFFFYLVLLSLFWGARDDLFLFNAFTESLIVYGIRDGN